MHLAKVLLNIFSTPKTRSKDLKQFYTLSNTFCNVGYDKSMSSCAILFSVASVPYHEARQKRGGTNFLRIIEEFR